MRLLTAGSSVRARQEEPKGKAVWTIVHAAFPFCFLYLLSQSTLCFGRRIAAVCTTLAWCAAEVVCRHCAQHSEASLLEEPKKKELGQKPGSFFFIFFCFVLTEDGSGAEREERKEWRRKSPFLEFSIMQGIFKICTAWICRLSWVNLVILLPMRIILNIINKILP